MKTLSPNHISMLQSANYQKPEPARAYLVAALILAGLGALIITTLKVAEILHLG